MCGIIGYIGKKDNIKLGLDALKRLEYRGYDSAGGAWFNSDKKEVFCLKSVGRIDDLEEKVKKSSFDLVGSPFIFHTRWATHGTVTEENTHPHFDCGKNIFLVHNGIIENHRFLKDKLLGKGHKFSSETDTEVIAHLIEHFFQGNLEKAVRKALRLIKGTYALAIIAKNDPDKLVAVRVSSPLVIGVNGEKHLVASDQLALAPYVKKMILLDDNEIATITPEDFFIYKERTPQDLDVEGGEIQKAGYPHFMLKEIMEQPESVRNSIGGRLILEEGRAKLGGLELVKNKLKEIKRFNIIACGTAYYSGLAGEYMLEEYVGLPTEVDFASEFRYRKPILDKNNAFLFVSQSGETADSLAALREVKEKGGLVLGMVNTVGSSIARETDAGVYNHAGPEIGVASTKILTSQLTIFALLTLFFGRQREMSLVTGRRIAQELFRIPDLLKKTLELSGQIKEIAEKYKHFNDFLYLGRKYNFPIALEGALKLKEISYIHAEGCGAGEMKHGPLALISENFPTVAIAPTDSVYEKTLSNLEEIKARKGPLIVVATEGNEEMKKLADEVIYIPKTLEMLTPILSVVPMQLLAYHMGLLRGCDVDKPRNLAKSVTVE